MRELIIDELHVHLNSTNTKIQEKGLLVFLDMLRSNRADDLKTLKNFYVELERFMNGRVVTLRNLAMDCVREAYQSQGENLRPLLQNLKKMVLDELDLKVMNEDEQELPPNWRDSFWVEELEKKPWKDRKEQNDQLNDFLSKISKLSSKADVRPIVDFAKKVSDTNVLAQRSTIKTIYHLASLMKKNFQYYAKDLLPSMLAKLKEKNKPLCEEIVLTIDKLLCCSPVDDCIDEFVENLKEKNLDKKLYILKILTMQAEQQKFKSANSIQKIVKAVVKILEENDLQVQPVAEEFLIRMGERYPEKVTPLL